MIRYLVIPLLFVFGTSLNALAGDFPFFEDTIITSGRDSIVCRITMVNDLNIFYDYQRKKSTRSDDIALSEVHAYIWDGKMVNYAQNKWKKRVEQKNLDNENTKLSVDYNFKDGAYRSYRDLLSHSPRHDSRFSMVTWNNHDALDLYRVASIDRSVGKNEINGALWAIYQDRQFYLNAETLNMRRGYIKIANLRKYSYFRGLPMLSILEEERISRSRFNFGLIGGAVTQSQIKQENAGKTHYVLNIESGISRLLNAEYLMILLGPYPKLLSAYKAEGDSKTIDLMQEYIGLLNDEEEKK